MQGAWRSLTHLLICQLLPPWELGGIHFQNTHTRHAAQNQKQTNNPIKKQAADLVHWENLEGAGGEGGGSGDPDGEHM